MQRHVSLFINRLVLALTVIAVIGWITGFFWEFVALGLLSYLCWTVLQACRLHRWLHEGLLSDPPVSHGLWGELFDAIYRLQLRQQRSHDSLQALIDRVQESTNSLSEAVIMTDKSGGMDWWNEAAEKLLGFRYPADRGVLIHNLLRAPEFKRYFQKKRYDEPLQLRSPRNTDVTLQIQITLFGEDDRLILAQDISRLVKLEQMRRDFVSNVSHELRTPLTVISGYLETLLDHSETLHPRWDKALKQMQSQSARMEALITDLLLLSRIENQGRDFVAKPVRMSGLLQSIHHDANALRSEDSPSIELSIESDSEIYGDETQLRSAFTNLVVNAMKYTPKPGGKVRMRWYTEGNQVVFSVEDTGIGIDPVHIPRLTERFYRADPSRHSSSGGTGLGLAIVKHVLLNHEAVLTIESTLGEGSCFQCRFPSSRFTPKALNAG